MDWAHAETVEYDRNARRQQPSAHPDPHCQPPLRTSSRRSVALRVHSLPSGSAADCGDQTLVPLVAAASGKPGLHHGVTARHEQDYEQGPGGGPMQSAPPPRHRGLAPRPQPHRPDPIRLRRQVRQPTPTPRVRRRPTRRPVWLRQDRAENAAGPRSPTRIDVLMPSVNLPDRRTTRHGILSVLAVAASRTDG